jgi:hypothetical protein
MFSYDPGGRYRVVSQFRDRVAPSLLQDLRSTYAGTGTVFRFGLVGLSEEEPVADFQE